MSIEQAIKELDSIVPLQTAGLYGSANAAILRAREFLQSLAHFDPDGMLAEIDRLKAKNTDLRMRVANMVADLHAFLAKHPAFEPDVMQIIGAEQPEKPDTRSGVVLTKEEVELGRSIFTDILTITCPTGFNCPCERAVKTRALMEKIFGLPKPAANKCIENHGGKHEQEL